MKKLFFLLLLLLTACGGSPYIDYQPSAENRPTIEWEAYEPTSLESLDKKRLVLLYLEMNDCDACLKMEETTLKDPIVILKINEFYTPLKSKEGDDNFDFLSNKYKVSMYPAYVAIAAPDYDKGIMTAQGFVNIKTFIMFLNSSKDLNNLLNMQYMNNDLIDSLIKGK